jgi:erythromycin esterase
VQGSVDSEAHAIANIRLWPFTTMEMLEVIAWMREFNAKNPDRMLSFRGCDMQYGRDDSAELMRLMRKYDIPLRTPPSLPGTGDHDSSISVAREKMRDCIAFVDSAQILFSGIRMLRSDSVDLQMLLKGLAFYFQKTNSKVQERRAFRDSCMASNILEFLRSDPSNRIFLWAHNGHIAHARSNMAETKPCGYFLRSALANKYLAIGTEMNEGMIYAMSWNSELHQYVPKNSYLKAAPKHTLPWLLAKKNMEMLYLEVQHLQYPNQWKMTAIGGAYPLSHDGTQVQRFSRLLSGFDGIIYVNSTTALQVISRK